MVKIYDGYEGYLEGNSFSSPRKNLGNKLFIYAACKILADILDYDLEVPENSLVYRMDKQYVFPFGSISGRKRIEEPYTWINDLSVVTIGSLEHIAKAVEGRMLYTNASFTAYPLLKPYESEVRKLYESLVGVKRTDDSILVMLRDSYRDAGFKTSYNFYYDILENETFDKVYISSDHPEKHEGFLSSISKYNPICLDDLGIFELFKEITTFKKIIASQGTFAFWAAWLSHAETIYWPLTEYGPNSYYKNPNAYYDVNVKVEGEDRYKFVEVKN